MNINLRDLRDKVGQLIPVVITSIDDLSIEYHGVFLASGFLYWLEDSGSSITHIVHDQLIRLNDERSTIINLVDYLESEAPVEIKNGVMLTCICEWDNVKAYGCKCGAIKPYVLVM